MVGVENDLCWNYFVFIIPVFVVELDLIGGGGAGKNVPGASPGNLQLECFPIEEHRPQGGPTRSQLYKKLVEAHLRYIHT